MTQTTRDGRDGAAGGAAAPAAGGDHLLGVGALFGTLLRFLPVVAVVAGVGVVGLYAYQRTLPQRFASQVDLLLDIKQMLRANDRLDASIGVPKSSLVHTQITLMRSKGNLEAVVRKLGLVDEPEFRAAYEEKKARDRRLALLGTTTVSHPGVDEAEARLAAAVEEVDAFLQFETVDGTYVVNVIYSGRDPVLAARIANEVTAQYMRDQLTARYDATLKAGDWVQRRLEDLKEQSRQAAFEVEEFRREAGIVDAAGQTLTDAKLAELGRRLVETQARLSELEATQRVVDRILEEGDTGDDMFRSVDDAAALELRQRYAVALALREQTVRIVGTEDHDALRDQDRQIETLRTQLWQSLERYARRVSEEHDVAASEMADLARSFEEAKATYVAEREVGVKLVELERAANVMHQTYANFYRGYVQLSQKNPFPTSEIRVIGEATPSFSPKYPAKTAVLANGIIAFAGLGLTAAVMLMRARTRLRSAGDVAQLVGVPALGVVTKPPRGVPPERHLASSAAFTHAATRLAADLRPFGAAERGVAIGVFDDASAADAAMVAMAVARLLADYGESVLFVKTVDGAAVDEEYRIATVEEGLDMVAIPRGEGAKAWIDYRHALEVALDAGRSTHHFVVLAGPPVRASAPARSVAELVDGIVVTARAGRTDGPGLAAHLGDLGRAVDKVAGVLLLDGRRPIRLPVDALRRRMARRGAEPAAEMT